MRPHQCRDDRGGCQFVRRDPDPRAGGADRLDDQRRAIVGRDEAHRHHGLGRRPRLACGGPNHSGCQSNQETEPQSSVFDIGNLPQHPRLPETRDAILADDDVRAQIALPRRRRQCARERLPPPARVHPNRTAAPAPALRTAAHVGDASGGWASRRASIGSAWSASRQVRSDHGVRPRTPKAHGGWWSCLNVVLHPKEG